MFFSTVRNPTQLQIAKRFWLDSLPPPGIAKARNASSKMILGSNLPASFFPIYTGQVVESIQRAESKSVIWASIPINTIQKVDTSTKILERAIDSPQACVGVQNALECDLRSQK